MWYKRYRKRNYQKKYNILDDLAWVGAIILLLVGIKMLQVFKENQILFWSIIWWITLLVVVVIWLAIKRTHRKYMRTKTVQQMKDMNWREFEKFISFVFKKKGFRAKVGKGTNDGGIDVTATKNGQKYLIQCKKWNKYKIGSEELQKFVGAMDGEWENIIWIFVTTSRLTKPAQVYLEKVKHKLELWDADNLEEYVRAFTGKEEIHHIQEETLAKERAILCEKCGADMIIRQANKWTHKWEEFYWCSNFPKCRHITQIKNH